MVSGLTDVEDRMPGAYQISRCDRCGVNFLSVRPVPEDIPLCYPRTYHIVTPRSANPVARAMYALRAICRLRRLQRVCRRRPTTVLEVGCGDGRFLQLLERRWGRDVKLVGVELSESRMEVPKGSHIHLLSGGIETSSLNDWFDLVLMYEVLEHVSHPKQVLLKAAGRMRAGSLLLGSVPSWESPWRRLFPKHWAGLQIPRHQVFFDRASLSRLLEETGFEVVGVYPVYDPGDLSVSLCNWITDRCGLQTPPRKSWFFLPLALLAAPVVLAHTVLGFSGVIGFAARKVDNCGESPR